MLNLGRPGGAHTLQSHLPRAKALVNKGKKATELASRSHRELGVAPRAAEKMPVPRAWARYNDAIQNARKNRPCILCKQQGLETVRDADTLCP